MQAREFYEKRLKENPTMGSVELMELYAKHIIDINFCDGSPMDFDKLSIEQLKKMNHAVNLCIQWSLEE